MSTVYETDPWKLTRQFKEIDPTVKSVGYSDSVNYNVTYEGGTTNTLTREGLANLQRKYILNPKYE